MSNDFKDIETAVERGEASDGLLYVLSLLRPSAPAPTEKPRPTLQNEEENQ